MNSCAETRSLTIPHTVHITANTNTRSRCWGGSKAAFEALFTSRSTFGSKVSHTRLKALDVRHWT